MAIATEVPEAVDKLFGKKGRRFTEFDKYIEERTAKGDAMADMVLIVPQSMGAPGELQTRYGRLWVLSSAKVDRCYLLSVKDEAGEEFTGVCKRAREARDGGVQVPQLRQVLRPGAGKPVGVRGREQGCPRDACREA